MNWSASGADPIALLAFLENGSLPATPSPTPDGPTATPTPTTGGGETFDFSNYFILASNSNWHYTGIQGAGNEDDFRWTVEATTQDVGGGKQATRIRTDTDEPTDDRYGDVDFWFRENNGDVFYYGTHLANDHDPVPAQDIVLTDPLLIGRNGLTIGDTITDTGSTTVVVNTPLGDSTLPGTANVEIHFTEFLPTFTTPLGTFTNVLRMEIDITITIGTPFGPVDFDVRDNTFFLKEGVGLIGQDQEPDPSDAQIQGIDEGTVSGVAVVAN